MTRLSLLAVLAAAALSTACASPNYTMGPDSARYVGSTYRHRDMVASTGAVMAPSATAPAATDVAPSELAFTAPPPVANAAQLGVAPQGVPAPRVTQSVSVETNKGTRTARSVPIPPKGAAAVAPPVAPTIAAPAPAPQVSRPVDPAPAARVEPVVQESAGASETPTPPAARRFVRLKISGMESPETDPMEVRRQLRAASGVKEVVLSFKTRTAIVVVDGAVETSALIAALQAPYGAETLN